MSLYIERLHLSNDGKWMQDNADLRKLGLDDSIFNTAIGVRSHIDNMDF